MFNIKTCAVGLFLTVAITLFLAGCGSNGATSSTGTTATTTVTTETTSPTPGLQPVAVVSVTGPLTPINPGGPNVKIVLQNSGGAPLVALTATLELVRSYDFNFAVTTDSPLAPGASVAATLSLIGGGFSDSLTYPLTIQGTWQNGNSFS
jgi:hypothetical protein